MSVPALDAAETRRAMDAARGVLRMLQNAPPKGKLNQYKAALSDLKDAVIETRRYQNKKVRDGDGSRPERGRN
jgi:hypothetical protein